MASGSVCVTPGQAPGEERRGAELAERPGPGQSRAGGEARAGQGHLDAEEGARRAGAQRARRADELPVHGAERGDRLADVEGHGDERLRHHDRDPGEGDVDVEAESCAPSMPMRPKAAKSAMPATAGGSTRGSSRKVARTLRPGNRCADQVRHRRADDDDEGERDEARLEADAQRVAGDLGVQLVDAASTAARAGRSRAAAARRRG